MTGFDVTTPYTELTVTLSSLVDRRADRRPVVVAVGAANPVTWMPWRPR
ncbi:MAG: hypothetical protein R2705_06010 [Ilumatobacteraceae bacterium]